MLPARRSRSVPQRSGFTGSLTGWLFQPSLTPEQQQWLDKIREHLIANLSISKDDFDIIPIFANEGGWGRANRVFDGNLP